MNYFFNILLFLSPFVVFSQVSDAFSDGDFSANPTWIGDDSVFVIDQTTGNPRLKSNKQLTNTTFSLATSSTQIATGQWEVRVQLGFNTSSANYVDWYLTATQPNFTGSFEGYFVRLGGTTDEISLYKRVGTTNTKIIDGTDGVLNNANSSVLIKVKKLPSGEWTLERDLTATGNSFVLEGSVIDNSITTATHTGFSITQSTASFFGKHFFDDLYVGPIIVDTTPPELVSAEVLTANQVMLQFSEAVTVASAEVSSNYAFLPALTVQSAVLSSSDPKQVVITFTGSLVNGQQYVVQATGMADLSGNVSGLLTTQFSYLVAENPAPGDVIITEFFMDPSPRVGLPEIEFVEIHNKSTKYFQLNGWKLGDNSSQGTLQSRWLYPGEYVVLTPSSGVDSFPQSVGVTSFPSLNNTADEIRLLDASGLELDALSYTDAWYQDPSKTEGGWTLERINLEHPCSAAANWRASTHPSGGTPGLQNAVWNNAPDVDPPLLLGVQAIAPNFLEVRFSEGMDSTSLIGAQLSVQPGNLLTSVLVTAAGSNEALFVFQNEWQSSQLYTVTIQGAADCWGNTSSVTTTFGLAEFPQVGEIVINEILHDPLTGGADFVEVYNRTSKWLQLEGAAFANFDDDTIANLKHITEPLVLGPYDFKVFTPDSQFVKNTYPATKAGKFYALSLPTYSNDSSTVYLLSNGQVIDRVSYTDDFHFRLLDNIDGKSLERINPDGPSQAASNWTTAAETIGFATPGGENSQFMGGKQVGDFAFTVPRLSPDQDGWEDVLQLNYVFDQPSYYATISVYDERGRLVTELLKSELLAARGTIQWDGVTDQNLKASVGTYVMVVEATDLSGGVVVKKRLAFVVAGKL